MSTIAADIPDLAGISYRQLDHWVRKGYLHADNPECGSGHSRTFQDEEVEVAVIMGALVKKLTIEPEYAATLARTIRSHGLAKVGPYVLARVAA